MIARTADPSAQWEGGRFKRCDNARYGVCNWLADAGESLCASCLHNRTVPNLSDSRNIELWGRLENAKRYLFYSLVTLGLPIGTDLRFDFLADDQDRVLTGHESGLITIALMEADDAERENRRDRMREPYRTLLGHFRHEIGHYYWEKLVTAGPWLAEFRRIFGDETDSYETRLSRYHQEGPPGDWPSRFVSAYGSAHPWEDFAETWAHYLHIRDTLETAREFELSGQAFRSHFVSTSLSNDLRSETFTDLATVWVPMTLALNTINRSMGLRDLYPFVLSRGVFPKLQFVHDLVRSTSTQREDRARN